MASQLLVDIFEENSIDHGTIVFLVEALSNADQSDWSAILEPFVEPAPVLSVIQSDPGILEHAALTLTTEKGDSQATMSCDFSEAPGNSHGMGNMQNLFESHDTIALQAGLLDAGFTALSEDVFSHAASGVTVELFPDALPHVTMDGCPQERVMCFTNKAFASEGAYDFGHALLNLSWQVRGSLKQVDAEVQDDASSCEGSDSEMDSDGFDPKQIPSSTELGTNPHRQLVVITWGFFKLAKPPEAQVLFNCSCKKFHYLTRNNKHIKKLNGLHDVVQGRICRNTFFEPWLREATSRIEGENLTRISLCDAKGTHLVVAIAEIMRKTYYPKAEVMHLTLTQNRPGHAGGSRRH